MKYNMTEQIQEIAKLRGINPTEVADELEVDYSARKWQKEERCFVDLAQDEIEFGVWSRREELKVLNALEKARQATKKEEIKKEAVKTRKNYTWKQNSVTGPIYDDDSSPSYYDENMNII